MATYEHDTEACLTRPEAKSPGPTDWNAWLDTGETITAVTVTASEGRRSGPRAGSRRHRRRLAGVAWVIAAEPGRQSHVPRHHVGGTRGQRSHTLIVRDARPAQSIAPAARPAGAFVRSVVVAVQPPDRAGGPSTSSMSCRISCSLAESPAHFSIPLTMPRQFEGAFGADHRSSVACSLMASNLPISRRVGVRQGEQAQDFRVLGLAVRLSPCLICVGDVVPRLPHRVAVDPAAAHRDLTERRRGVSSGVMARDGLRCPLDQGSLALALGQHAGGVVAGDVGQPARDQLVVVVYSIGAGDDLSSHPFGTPGGCWSQRSGASRIPSHTSPSSATQLAPVRRIAARATASSSAIRSSSQAASEVVPTSVIG